MVTIRGKQGTTLVELLIAGALISLIFVGAGSAYITSLELLQKVRESSGGGPDISTETDAFIAVEHISKRARLANKVILGLDGADQQTTLVAQQIKLRLDYNPSTLTPMSQPLGSTFNKTDDRWVKYAFFKVGEVRKLRWKLATTEGGDVSSSDPEVVPGLNLVALSGSPPTIGFERKGAVVGPGTVFVYLTTNAAGRTFTLRTNIMPHLLSNSGDS